MRLNYLTYAFMHPRMALDYVMRERKVARLCTCSTKEVRGYLREVKPIKTNY